MSTDATVVIKGRNDLGLAVKQAEQQLRRLNSQGEQLGKLFRGGAIIGAAVAFERLAENAEIAARKIGDQGAANALRKFNLEVDNLKSKVGGGLASAFGRVVEAAYALGDGGSLAFQIKSVAGVVEYLRKQLESPFLIGRAGTERELAEMERQLDALIMKRDRLFRGAPGGRNRASFVPVDIAPSAKSAGAKAPQFSAEFLAYVDGLERAGEAQRSFQASMDDVDKSIRSNFAEGLEVAAGQLEQLTSTAKDTTTQMTVFAEEAARQMQTSLAQYLFDPFEDGLRGMAAGFIDTIRQMVAQLAAQEILTAFFTWGSGLGGTVGRFSSSLLKGVTGKAIGGPVSGGSPYIVGERGPELFVPGASGSIVPNHALGGGVTLNYSIDARGADAERIMAIMPGLLQRSKAETVAEVRNLIARGRI